MKVNDREMVEMALKGDKEAFGKLVRIYQNAVYTTVFRIIGNFADAQDITQEIFIEAYTKLYQLKEPDKFAGWLRSISINTCKMMVRSRKNLPENAIISNESVDTINETGLYEQLTSTLTLLPEEQRTVLVLRCIDDLSYEQIGKFLGITIGTVKSRLHRARERLRRKIIMVKEVLDSVKLDPNFPEKVKRTISEIEEVIQNEGKKLETEPANSAAHFELGCGYAVLYQILLINLSRNEKAIAERAIEHLKKATEYGDGTAGVYLKMAEVYSSMGEVEKVKEMVNKARCFYDLREEEWINSILSGPLCIAMICLGKGQYTEAEAMIRMSLELTSTHNAEAYTMMARAYAGKCNTPQAITALKKALEFSQSNEGKKPKLRWVLPENSVDWTAAKVSDYVRKCKEFDTIRNDPQVLALLNGIR